MTEGKSNQGQPVMSPAPGEPRNDGQGFFEKLEAILEDYLVKRAPFQIPMGGKEFIVKVTPYLIILGILLAIPATLMVVVLSPLVVLGGGSMAFVALLFSAASLVLEAIALPGLFKRTRGSWRLLFYATLVSVAGSLVGLHLVSAVISALICWYILFQVRELYKN